MAILIRGGLYEDFDPGKLKPREWAVVLGNDPGSRDGRTVYLCFGSGVVKRIATHEDMADIILNATEDIQEEFMGMFNEILAEMRRLKTDVEGYKNAAVAKAGEAGASATTASTAAATATEKAGEASDFSDLSESYAVGTKGAVREGDATDNSKYYSEQSKASADKSKTYLTKVEKAGDDAVGKINDALNIAKPNFLTDLATGHLLYDGSWFDFSVINGHLGWEAVV